MAGTSDQLSRSCVWFWSVERVGRFWKSVGVPLLELSVDCLTVSLCEEGEL